MRPLSLGLKALGRGRGGRWEPQDSCEPQGAQMGPDAACDEVLGLPSASAVPWSPEHIPGLTANTTGYAPLLHLSCNWTLALLLCSRISRGVGGLSLRGYLLCQATGFQWPHCSLPWVMGPIILCPALHYPRAVLIQIRRGDQSILISEGVLLPPRIYVLGRHTS